MVYKSKFGLGLPAETVARELNRIADANGGVLDPQQVVNESRSENAVLHPLFEWDDAVAAEKYRVVQARYIIRNVTIQEGDTPLTRQFVHAGGSGYVKIGTALQNVDMTKALLAQAKADMNAFVAKYRTLEQMARVVSTMEEYLEEAV